ncbi:phage terminase small subunit P27 family [Bacillus taeanensis]|uniref:Phage terminase small subunit P27 family n=1 Tax=Bacillus taeanensis TaxID=273032 RepID=A0A366XV66_9BACI|nr:phage terminase small subunit P27 family [Bacillus taeanensis]RBW69468.1 phage terminase small subunit P27 family [Bacillus taeanensis]
MVNVAGRKAKPVNLHLLEGNKSHLTKEEIEKRQKAEESLTLKSDNIKPPTWLDSEGKKTFRKLIKEFEEIDLLVNVDVYMIAMFCDAYSDYIECTKIIQDEGKLIEHTNKAGETNRIPHPLLTKKSHAFNQMKAMASEFGLTPSARTKLIQNMQVEGDNEDNSFSGRV